MARKIVLLAAVAALLVAALGAGAASARGGRDSITLYEKDANWDIVTGGARGNFQYWADWDEYEFKFTGHGLERGEQYQLIYYPDPWPGNGLVCLGDAEYANRGGKVRVRDSVRAGDLPLPAVGDANYLLGAKIWLVLSDDVDCTNRLMLQGNPTEYLFEGELVSLPKRFLYLYEKVPTGEWPIVPDGAEGRMDFRPDGAEFRIHMDAKGLEPRTDYTLIYYPDPWPGKGLVCFGDDTSDRRGRIHIWEKIDVSGIPDNVKIWLVLSDDVDCDNHLMVHWNPAEYLFENGLTTFG